MFFIDPEAHGAKHEALLPPMFVPLRCKSTKGRGVPYPLQRWEAMAPMWSIKNPNEDRSSYAETGEIIVVTEIEYGWEWKGNTHDVWKLTIQREDGRTQDYLWCTHQIFAPYGTQINDWTDWWEPASDKV